MILQNIWRRVVGNVVINISPSNIFQKMLLVEKYIQNCQACFGLFECEWVKYQKWPSDQENWHITVLDLVVDRWQMAKAQENVWDHGQVVLRVTTPDSVVVI